MLIDSTDILRSTASFLIHPEEGQSLLDSWARAFGRIFLVNAIKHNSVFWAVKTKSKKHLENLLKLLQSNEASKATFLRTTFCFYSNFPKPYRAPPASSRKKFIAKMKITRDKQFSIRSATNFESLHPASKTLCTNAFGSTRRDRGYLQGARSLLRRKA